jgi:hypothetical protein
MNCNQASCTVSFDVTSKSDDVLPLIYNISLNQNHIRDPHKSGLVVVGEADGAINLLPKESRTMEVEIDVTETPNGSSVSVLDSRTPELVLELLRRFSAIH